MQDIDIDDLAYVHISKGLDDVVVKETVLSYIDGENGRLFYVGYPIEELVEHSTYEEVCFLLLHGRLPKKDELESFTDLMKSERELPKELVAILSKIPRNSNLMDVLKFGIDYLAICDEELQSKGRVDNIVTAAKIISKSSTIVAYAFRYSEGLEIVRPSQELSHAANFLYMVTGVKPDSLSSKIMDVAFILHAEHELPASSMAALVIASTLSDLYSAISGGVGALKGPLHGGANEKALEMILSIGSPENVEGYVKQVLASKGRIMGFGHRVYKSYDPRAAIFRRYLESLSQQRGDRSFLDITKKLEEVVRRELAGKPIFPNIDLYSGAVFHMLGLSKRVFTPLFAAARTVGWAAHVLEYWRDNRLIRPRATYVGPPMRRYIPVHQR
ncbi:Citrate synthase [archaeon HR01]|nr:Citrate synthase [archaeon HR01]